ncbi:hypothetical protein [Streptomyces sp. NPDC050485]|uniref:hypothetical protein n=1 Tax=Streptomyces sp. NPDC050485 TaxID=3365617 RepID=UPI0037BCF885
MTTPSVADGEPELIGRCYTKARRAPLVYGVIRDVRGGQGIRLPGGPYTLTQLASIIATVAVLLLSRPVWGGHGWVDAALLIGLPFAVSFAVRQLHIDGRNPVAAMASVVMLLAAPRAGRLHGRACRLSRAARAAALITLGEPAPAPGAVEPSPAAAAAPVPAVLKTPGSSGAGMSAAGPRRRVPPDLLTVSPSSGTPLPVASGVQALLARRTPSKD